MKLTLHPIVAPGLLAVALLAAAGCASAGKTDKTTTVAFQEGVPGGALTQTYETTARVTAIDAVARRLSLVAPDGSTNTFRAGPDVNLERIRVDEALKVTVVRELVVYLNRGDAPATPGVTAVAGTIPGARPGVLTSDTVQLTATVVSMDLSKREATLKISDGRTGTFKIRRDVDLAAMKPGTEVYIRTTSALVIMAGNP